MGTAFWIRRFFLVFAIAFAVIAGAQFLKGRGIEYSAQQAAFWGVLSAVVFTTARFYQARRGVHCAICKDTPEMNPSHREETPPTGSS
ncbi:hypothetical protein BH18VER1_BH18VER1_18370 [soil metagenome]